MVLLVFDYIRQYLNMVRHKGLWEGMAIEGQHRFVCLQKMCRLPTRNFVKVCCAYGIHGKNLPNTGDLVRV